MINDYENQTLFDDPETSNIFWKIIDKRIEKILRQQEHYNICVQATVISVNGNLANIKLQTGTDTIPNVKNKTGEVLNTNDKVYVELINGSYNNMVIKYKIN